MHNAPGIQLTFCEGWNPIRTFVCQDPDMEQHGCNINCVPCQTGGGGLGGSMYQTTGCNWAGKHWMRPDHSKPHRNAMGLVAPLITGVMMPMPYWRVSFEGAPCATDIGHECFGGGFTVCDCKDFPIGFFDPAVCAPGSLTPPNWIFNDCQAYYVGWSWASPADGWMRCRLARPPVPSQYQAYSVTVTADNGDMFQVQSLRRGSCNCNLVTTCVGIRPQNECAEEPSAPYNDEASGGTRTVWRDLFLLDAPIVWTVPEDTPTPTPGEDARLHIRNQVGEWLNDQIHTFGGGIINFDRLVHIGWGNNTVGRHGSYERHFNQFGINHPDPAFAFATYPNCYLKYSGCPITVTAIVWRIAFRLNMVLLHDTGDVGPPSASYVRVSVRIHVDFDLRVIAELQGECFAVRSWLDEDDPLRSVPLTIQEQGGGDSPPIVVAPPGSDLPTPADEIVYVDNEGRAFDFPWHVKWKGYLGSVSEPEWPSVLANGDAFSAKYPECDPGLDGKMCCGLARELSPLVIGPHPTQFGAGAVSPNGLYNGSVKVEYRDVSGACGCAWG